MHVDDLNKLIFKKIESTDGIPSTKEFQTVMVGSNGKAQIIQKLPRNMLQDGNKVFTLNTSKRWYRIYWGNRAQSSSIKAHGEMSVAMINPVRFLHKLHSSDFFTVRDFQILLSEQVTSLLQEISGPRINPDEVRKKLNEDLEIYGLEISVMDFYKGAH
jgi:hypothetical protein